MSEVRARVVSGPNGEVYYDLYCVVCHAQEWLPMVQTGWSESGSGRRYTFGIRNPDSFVADHPDTYLNLFAVAHDHESPPE